MSGQKGLRELGNALEATEMVQAQTRLRMSLHWKVSSPDYK